MRFKTFDLKNIYFKVFILHLFIKLPDFMFLYELVMQDNPIHKKVTIIPITTAAAAFGFFFYRKKL